MDDLKKTNKPRADEVVREFPAIGKYRVRLLKRPRKGNVVLDIREYVSTENFEGLRLKAHKPSYVALWLMCCVLRDKDVSGSALVIASF